MEKKEGMDKIEDIKKEYPEVFKEVALHLYTMPVTQVSVEHMFSAQRLNKTDLTVASRTTSFKQCSPSRPGQ